MRQCKSVWLECVVKDAIRPAGKLRRPRPSMSDETGQAVAASTQRLFVHSHKTRWGASVPLGSALRQYNGEMLMFLRLMRLDRFFVDALVTDENDKLLFLSAWCRDTVAQEFLAKMSLSSANDGFQDSTLVFEGDATMRVALGRDDKLEKRQGKVSGGVFGDNLVHLWVFAPICITPDAANARAVLLMRPDDSASASDRLWSIVKTISPAPLLDDWRTAVVSAFEQEGWIKPLSGFGLAAIDLDLTDADQVIGDMVRSGVLTASQSPVAADNPQAVREAAYA